MNVEEVLKQATQYMTQENLNEALTILEKGLLSYPGHPQMLFLFAAANAQNQNYDVAIEAYQLTLQHEPKMHIARFQLGLLFATLGREIDATGALEPLIALSESYLGEFASGIIGILNDQLPKALEHIQQGLKLNDENPSLNHDMQAMFNRVVESGDDLEENKSIKQDNLQAESNAEPDNSHLLDIYNTKH